MKYQQILDENGNVLAESGKIPTLINFDLNKLQTAVDSINNIRKKNEKLTDELDFKELDFYKNNAVLSLFKTLLGEKYNDGFGVYLYENQELLRVIENSEDDLKIEQTSDSFTISSGNKKIFEKNLRKNTKHNINNKTVEVSYSIYDTFYGNEISYNFFDNKMTFNGNKMLFDENGMCIEGTFIMDSEEGLKTKKVVRDNDDMSLVHVTYYNDSEIYNSEDKYLATLEKINSEAHYNEKEDKETYIRRLDKNLVAFPNLKNSMIETYQLQNSKSL